MIDVFFIVFGGVLFALLLDALMAPIRTALPRQSRVLALLVVAAGLALAGAGMAWIAGSHVSEQMQALGDRLPSAIEELTDSIRRTDWGRTVLQGIPPTGELVARSTALLTRVPSVFSTLAGAVSAALFAVFIGVFGAARPEPYVNGFLRLIPRRGRGRAREVLGAVAHALRMWLVGRFASMAAVGVLTALGLWFLEVPLWLALGGIAALFAFVPYLGPILSVVPAVLVVFPQGLVPVVQVLALYAVVQALEGNVVTPWIQSHAVSLPPVLVLLAQISAGALFGFVGILFATPLAVVVVLLVQMLYVEQFLGEEVHLLAVHGEDEQEEEAGEEEEEEEAPSENRIEADGKESAAS